MRIRYMSPSRITTFDMCNYSYKLSYEYGLKGFQNSGAAKGSAVHETIEEILNIKRNGGEIKTTPDFFEPILIEKFNEQCEIIELSDDDFVDCSKWVNTVLNDENGNYINSKIIGVEHKFDLVIDKNGKLLCDNLEETAESLGIEDSVYMDAVYGGNCFRLYGIIDLIVEKDGILEIVDWKTSKVVKKYESLDTDVQLKMYNLISHYLFPKYDSRIVTIYFIQHKKPMTVYFDNNGLDNTIEYLYNKWHTIKNMKYPRRTLSPENKWKCCFCAFKRDMVDFKACKRDCDKFYAADERGDDLSAYIEKAKSGERL